MAGTRAKTQPIGSAGWIQSEREQTAQFVEAEVEEFGYSVRNELEWLNEHMADVFARNNVTLADVFKTPGKLRGKTPRTARKRDALGVRQPLTDIFAPNGAAPQSVQRTPFLDKVHQFAIAEDDENQPSAARPISRSKSPQRVGKPGNTDSGYHGMTEDEMDVDNRTETATDYSSQQSAAQKVPLRENQGPAQRIPETVVEARDGDTSGDSFMSAKEDFTSKAVSKEPLREIAQEEDVMDVDQGENEKEFADDVEMMEAEDDVAIMDEDQDAENNVEVFDENDDAQSNVEAIEEDQDIQNNVEVINEEQNAQNTVDVVDEDQDAPDETITSDVSSPEKPLQRKSSFTFAALPPRDTLGAKRSMGPRNSQMDAAQTRTSTLGRSFGTKSTGLAQDDVDQDDAYSQEKPEESIAHNKTSTQLLHERINMLGKTKEPRPSKSIAQNTLSTQPAYPQLPATSETKETALPIEDDDDDDWIAPSRPAQQVAEKTLSPTRPPMHQKSISTTAIPSPRPNADVDPRSQKAVSVSNPNFAYAEGQMSTTPAGSPPAKKQHEGHLSASKNRLYSVLKSAKSIFASSASASAAAKLEAHNTPSKSPKRQPSNESKTAAVFNMPGAMYSERQFADPPKSPTRSMISLVSKSPSRKTRSSSENEKKREKEAKAQQKAAEELEKVREKERQKASKQQEKAKAAEQAEAARREKELPRPPTAESDQGTELEQSVPPEQQKQQPKSMLPGGKLRAPGRLAKPTRTEAAQPARPAPMSVRVPSQSQRFGQASASTLSKSHHENNASGRPPTAGSTRSGSAQASVRGPAAPNNARVKALEAAARKKEADERAAQKKLEQKRELERKRAAKLEEERRAEEERKAAEVARLQEAKLAAQRQAEKQAAEQRRKEEAREAQRRQDEAQRAKAAQELAEAIKRERAQEAQKQSRGDVGGTLRQLAKHTVPDNAQKRMPQMNPAKPAKRMWNTEEEEAPQQQQHHQAPQRPGAQRGPPSYQQHDAKRRRTNEEEQPTQQNPGRNSVMAPPMRPSAMRKDSNLSKFPHGYAHAPPPAPHNTQGLAQSMFKAAVTAQHQLHHPGQKSGMPNHPSQTVQVSNARIPFAENANPQAAQHYYQPQASGHENLHPTQASSSAHHNKYKTPVRPQQAPKSAAKSSPLYPNGDAIQLPEIQTDSEDEDSEDDEDNTGAFRAPSWVASPALRDLLTQQQLVDPESVFGPIGELKMDEVFKGAKNQERLRRFRDRGSSARWVESGDAVTSAEKRRDMEVRERVVREGGWRYEPGV